MTRSFAQKWIAIAPKVTASLSILGSGLIISKILQRSDKLANIYHRILLGMSLYDLIQSVALFLGSWPIPKDTPHMYGAAGNAATCSAQGFFFVIGHAVPLYNSFLSIHYVLKVRYRFSEERMRKIERPIHASIFAFVTAGATACVATGSINPAQGAWCWLASTPNVCGGGGVICERGRHAWLFRWVLSFTSLTGSMIVVTIAMIVLYNTVKGIEINSARYAGAHLVMEQRRLKKSRKVAKQGLFYVASFYATHLIPIINRIIEKITGNVSMTLLYISVVMYPSQGFFNFLVYKRSNNWNFDLVMTARRLSISTVPKITSSLNSLRRESFALGVNLRRRSSCGHNLENKHSSRNAMEDDCKAAAMALDDSVED